MSRPEPGDVIDGKYQVESILGEGGMGYVIRATHLLREAPVALKFLLPEVAGLPGLAKRFINEAVAASSLECDNVIKVYDVGEREGAPYLVMEYLHGQDLDHDIDNGALPVPRAVHILLQVLRGLSAAHKKGIVHRDLKPANVFLVEREGDPDFVKLLDFGVSKMDRPDDHRLTATGSGLGTPLYMSPEQARNAKSVDARADIYAAGAMLYQALSGRPPFLGDSLAELLAQVLMDEEPRLETLCQNLPPSFADIVHKALQKSPDKRFQNCEEFMRALAPFADDRSAVIIAKLKLGNLPPKAAVVPDPLPKNPEPGVSPAAKKPELLIATAATLASTATQREFSTALQDSQQPPAKLKKQKSWSTALAAVIAMAALAAGAATVAVKFSPSPSATPASDSASTTPAVFPQKPAATAETLPAATISPIGSSAPDAAASSTPRIAATGTPASSRPPKEPPNEPKPVPSVTVPPPTVQTAPKTTQPDNPLEIKIK